MQYCWCLLWRHLPACLWSDEVKTVHKCIHFQSKPVLVLEVMPVEDLISWHRSYLFSESCGRYQKHDFAAVNISISLLLLVGQAAHTNKLPAVRSPGRSCNANQNSVKLSTQDIITVFIYLQQLCRRAVDNRPAKTGVLPAGCLCLLTLHALAST